MTHVTPPYIETRMLDALDRLRRELAAHDRDHALAGELFAVEQLVEEALDARSRGMAEHAIRRAEALARQVQGPAPHAVGRD